MGSSDIESVLKLARRVEKTAVGAFERERFLPDTRADLLLITMAVRCLALFRGVIRCADDALADPAMVIARSLLELRFVVLAVARSADDAERTKRLSSIAAQAEHDRARALKKLKSLPTSDRSEQVTDELLSLAEAGLDVERRSTSAEQWARWAGLHGMYLTAYTSLSLHAHPSYLALDAMVTRSASDELSISAKPHQDRLAITVVSATEAMVDALAALPEGYVSREDIAAIALHREAVVREWQGIPEQDLSF